MRWFLLTLVLSLVLPSAALAVPKLQLDIGGGSYDGSTETIVTDQDVFTVYAYGSPTSISDAELLATDYYISVSLTPRTGPANADLGSFVFNGTSYDATADMTFGVPPIEFDGTAGHDGGDLGQHDVFETFFIERQFNFVAGQTSGVYNTQDDPGLGPIAGSDMFWVGFSVDISNLADDVGLHFDLYSEKVVEKKNDPTPDFDKDDFAPFSHDAGTGTPGDPIPEPSAALVFAVGALVVRGATRRRRA